MRQLMGQLRLGIVSEHSVCVFLRERTLNPLACDSWTVEIWLTGHIAEGQCLSDGARFGLFCASHDYGVDDTACLRRHVHLTGQMRSHLPRTHEATLLLEDKWRPKLSIWKNPQACDCFAMSALITAGCRSSIIFKRRCLTAASCPNILASVFLLHVKQKNLQAFQTMRTPYSNQCCGWWKLQFAGEAEEQVTADTADASADAVPTATPTPSDTDPPDDAASSGETRPNSTKWRAVCHVLNADKQLSGPVQFCTSTSCAPSDFLPWSKEPHWILSQVIAGLRV